MHYARRDPWTRQRWFFNKWLIKVFNKIL
uniref:Uncharacterized protein n=1 Tax=Arundo donax TaxID=35708 RepID=A0A0A8Z718_ARUDO